jgi:hypothetical protein
MTELIEIIDEEMTSFFQTKNEVMHEYYGIIGVTGFALYSFYKSMSNRTSGNIAFPSYKLIQKHLHMARTTINRYNWLLEQCELVRIITGNVRTNNVYRLLKVNSVTPELLTKLTEALQPNETDGAERAKFKATILKDVQNWQPLHAHFSTQPQVEKEPTKAEPTDLINCMAAETQKETGQPEIFSTNGSKPKQDLVETKPVTAESDELVQQLVEYFADNKPKLTKESAKKMILAYGAEKVQQQLEWLDQREIDDNPLKTLRASLKFDWLAPDDEPGELDEPIKTLFDDETRWIMPPTPLQEKWDRVQLFLKTQVISSTFNSLFQQTELVGIEGDVWIIQCESEQQKAWIEHRWMDVLYCSVASVAGEGIEIQFVVVVKEKVAWIPPSQRK